MKRGLLWMGGLLCGIGAALMVASVVMTYIGLSTSYNFGDPAKFQFVLVPFWQIGLALAAVGAVVFAAARRLKRGAS
jgi:hypothetical protein